MIDLTRIHARRTEYCRHGQRHSECAQCNPRRAPTLEERNRWFVLRWNLSRTLDEAARRTGMGKRECRNKAAGLRRAGVDRGKVMRKHPNELVEKYRAWDQPNSAAAAGTNAGSFRIPLFRNVTLLVVASDGGGWDHVSVHVGGQSRTPTWEEMCRVKDLFFSDDEVVMQLHPAKKDYVNHHGGTLHLWRPQSQEERAALRAEFGEDPINDAPSAIPMPPRIMV